MPSEPAKPTATQIAVVTGAGSGIGRAVAVGLGAAGFCVALAGRRADALHETAVAIATASGSGPQAVEEPVAAARQVPASQITGENQPADRTLVAPTDVTDPDAVEALFAATVERFGRVDVLFNNAGRGGRAVPLDETPVDEFEQVLAVNVTGMFLCARAAFGIMRHQSPQGGRIINNGSISAHTPRPWAVSYTVSKHAVTGLTKQVALDGRPYGITSSQIDIGNAASAMTARMAGGVRQADGAQRPEPTMDMASVVRSVVLMATLPADAAIAELTVMAPQMPYIGRG